MMGGFSCDSRKNTWVIYIFTALLLYCLKWSHEYNRAGSVLIIGHLNIFFFFPSNTVFLKKSQLINNKKKNKVF